MVRAAGVFALAWLVAGCTEQVMLDDIAVDASAGDAPAGKDASVGPDVDQWCAYRGMAFSPRAAQLLIALDRSSAMQGSFAGTTREKATIDALLPGLSSYERRVKFGFEHFPADSADQAPDCRSGCCAGSVRKPYYGNLNAIRDSLKCSEGSLVPCPPASYDSGSNAALEQIRNFYYSHSDRDDRYVLLVTAAEPSCGKMSGSETCTKALDAADALGDLGARIMVVSVGHPPTSGSCLVRISNAGSSLPAPKNLPPLYVATDQEGLNSYLGDLFSALAETACTLELNDPPPSWAQLIVSIDRLEIPQVDTSSGNGWSFSNWARTTIRLSGTACQQYITQPTSKVYVGYCSQ